VLTLLVALVGCALNLATRSSEAPKAADLPPQSSLPMREPAEAGAGALAALASEAQPNRPTAAREGQVEPAEEEPLDEVREDPQTRARFRVRVVNPSGVSVGGVRLAWRAGCDQVYATTAPDGSFDSGYTLDPGALKLEAYSTEDLVGNSVYLWLEAGREVDSEIRLQARGRVSLELGGLFRRGRAHFVSLAAAPTPAPGVPLRWSGFSDFSFFGDSAGPGLERFVRRLRAGRYRVLLGGEGVEGEGLWASAEFEVLAGQVARLPLTLRPRPLVRGRLLGEDGRALPGRLLLIPRDLHADTWSEVIPLQAGAAADGSFQVSLPPGRWRLTGLPAEPGWARAEAVLDSSEGHSDLDLDLRAAREQVVVVRSPDVSIVPESFLMAEGPLGSRLQFVDERTLRVRGLRPEDEVRISLFKQGFSPRVAARFRGDAGVADFKREPLARLQVEVLDLSALPVPGISAILAPQQVASQFVHPDPEESPPGGTPIETNMRFGMDMSRDKASDAKGRIDFGWLPPGRYTLTLSGSPSREVDLSADEERTLRVAIP